MFCLCLPGWQQWSAHLPEAIASGCIPVIVSPPGGKDKGKDSFKDTAARPDGLPDDLPFERVLNYSQFSLRLRAEELAGVEGLVRAVAADGPRVRAMQAALCRVWASFTYQPWPHPGDAFALTMAELGHRLAARGE